VAETDAVRFACNAVNIGRRIFVNAMGRREGHMKVWRNLFVGFSVLMLMGAGQMEASGASAPETIKVGAVVSLSGAFGSQGPEQRLGYQMAVDDINAKGGINRRAEPHGR
jgi:ABC-type branched-subunit amino acid transport system substrate-binding protein